MESSFLRAANSFSRAETRDVSAVASFRLDVTGPVVFCPVSSARLSSIIEEGKAECVRAAENSSMIEVVDGYASELERSDEEEVRWVCRVYVAGTRPVTEAMERA